MGGVALRGNRECTCRRNSATVERDQEHIKISMTEEFKLSETSRIGEEGANGEGRGGD